MNYSFKCRWEPSQNGKPGHESLFVENEHGDRYEMARLWPSSNEDPTKGVTLVRRDLNYDLGGKFIPQGAGQKEWNLAYEGAKDRGAFFARQQFESAAQMIHGRSVEMNLVGARQRCPEPGTRR